MLGKRLLLLCASIAVVVGSATIAHAGKYTVHPSGKEIGTNSLGEEGRWVLRFHEPVPAKVDMMQVGDVIVMKITIHR
jgi:hypothetical protein